MSTAIFEVSFARHIQLAMKACPYRADFYAKLGEPRDVVEREFQEWLKALEAIVTQIQAFLPPYSKGL